MIKRIVIGTAGHIDHGKTTLIKALTGIDCDRLKEEKERGITTELGFAHYKFGEDLLVGIVDVPGHEKFVRHMVAGAWGIDMALLIVAADEGVMPQTREHVDICELLGLKRGIVAITKKDLVDDDMVELVREDIEDFLKGRAFEGSPIIPVSSTTGENIDLLKEEIRKTAENINERSKEGIFRLPVDRVFTIKGLGTIITGTCISGQIRIGEEIEIYPDHRRARVKNIQAYHENVAEATAGQRVALNLQGIERNEIERGTIIGRPDTLMLSNRMDASFRYLKLPFKPIKTDSVLRFHIATTQEEVRLVLLTKDLIEPGEELFVQFVFAQPIVALPDDRYILRGSYAIQTIGGGRVLDIMPRKHKRYADYLSSTCTILSDNNWAQKAEYHILKGGYEGVNQNLLAMVLGKHEQFVAGIINSLISQGKVKLVGKIIIHMDRFKEYKKMTSTFLADFHKKNPLKIGVSKEELRTRLPKVDPSVFQAALDELMKDGFLEVDKDRVKIKSVARNKDKDIEALEAQILKGLLRHGFTPPGIKDFAVEVRQSEGRLRDVLERLIFEGKAVKVKGDLYFHSDVIEDLKKKVRSYLSEKKEMTPSEFKSVLDLSRKYMIPLLEYLDEIKVTIRTGDKRILRSS
ncbi:MAG TPA: selenocysteine-specific translation elongation factor [Syntrophorhabdus sp.]|jgi:selenocysteine-specific elongation factor|nr:selenocysteine-specific translation elongation factor [Pseudomonadota bacterium]OQB76100.1 MAG: Selenocysteine-specific elongation factor [Deltaproteobacteria bacterium ADurb.Bin135]HNQ47236.1 selenocysteine-specific translation elongation factor [Syntrophorhabdus sp.]HNS78610.1 selenocysteine-specific translation elongation factor [Syntrophorhabdus sp.]HPB38871.1 selenocysteine-specific translation elongation factor [Syntrophorhabdus sp.]